MSNLTIKPYHSNIQIANDYGFYSLNISRDDLDYWLPNPSCMNGVSEFESGEDAMEDYLNAVVDEAIERISADEDEQHQIRRDVLIAVAGIFGDSWGEKWSGGAK